MTSYEIGLSVLSGAAYVRGRSPSNVILFEGVAAGERDNRYYPDSGFEARAFDYGDKIVIAYTGTDPSTVGDIAADVALGIGIADRQLKQAAEFYQAIAHLGSGLSLSYDHERPDPIVPLCVGKASVCYSGPACKSSPRFA